MADGTNGLNVIVTGFIAVIIGLVLIGVVADQISTLDDIVNVVNETITVTVTDNVVTNATVNLDGSNEVQVNGSLYIVTFFGNATNSTHNTGVNVGEEVNFTRQGLITVAGGTVFGGSGPYNITYTFTTSGIGTTSVTEDVTSLDFFGNATMSTHITGIDVNEEVNLSSTGNLRVSTYNFSNSDYNISYTHEGANFVASKVSRTLINLVIIFFALTVLAIGFMVARDSFPDLFK